MTYDELPEDIFMPRPVSENITVLAEAKRVLAEIDDAIQGLLAKAEVRLQILEGRVDDPDAHNALQQASTALPKISFDGAHHIIDINIVDLTMKALLS